MGHRVFAVLSVVLLVACTVGPGGEASAVSGGATDGPTRSADSDRGIPTVYSYESGMVLEYDLDVVQDIEFTLEGDDALFGQGIPPAGRVVTTATSTIEYAVSPTSSPGVYSIAITARFPEADSVATVDGETVDPQERDPLTAALAEIQPIDLTVGVNDRNAVLSTTGQGGLDVLSGEVGALTTLSNNQLSRPIGPVFPEARTVDVGEEWRIESVNEGPGGPLVVASTHRVDARSSIEGVDVLDISTTTETDGFALDYSGIFRSLLAGFTSAESGEPVTEDSLALLDDIRFSIGVQPSIGTAVTRFDHETGVVRTSDQSSTVRLRWILEMPDGVDLGDSDFRLDLTISQEAVFELIESRRSTSD